jgi:uncharacterized membrane protein
MFSGLLTSFAFDPLIPWPLIALFGSAALIAAFFAGAGRLGSMFLRTLAAFILIAALANPQDVEESRNPLRDVVLVLTDGSESTSLGERTQMSAAASRALEEKLGADNNLDIITARIPVDNDGTRLTSTLIEALGNVPTSRLAGVIAITDGQVHDLPEAPQALLPDGVPFHALVIGDPERRDRRIRTALAPRYGLVGEQAEFEVLVEDPGHEGERATILIKLNGEIKAKFPATIGNRIAIPLTIERRGVNTVELEVEAAPGELTLKNNVFISEISGIRDRLQVLLVTGEPHMGGRAWRNLLKSDPAIDLVQFTILTNPRVKNTRAGSPELSLIAFPTDQLFNEELEEFDLIIFDQFRRRGTSRRRGRSSPLLRPIYLQNIAQYVENGGALLVATGPPFATNASLFRSPLAAVLPARPTGKTFNESYRAQLNEKGRRHPITAGFAGKEADNWGPWYRIIESNVVSGDVLMEGPSAEPLLVIDRVGDGRVAMLMSDQAWLWAKGFQGGGPYSEMFRRLSHWLMGEPDLAAERLSARAEGGKIEIERRGLSETAGPVTVQKPDGSRETVELKPAGEGRFTGFVEAAGQGAYRLSGDQLSTVTAIGALNPTEYADLMPSTDILSPLTSSTGGLIKMTGDGTDIPTLRRVKKGAKTSGENWMGLIAHDAYTVEASRRTPLAPSWLYALLAALALGWAWRREGA